MWKEKLFWVLTTMFFASTAGAAEPWCTGRPHTTHVLTVSEPATCVLARLFEIENFCLTDAGGNEISSQAITVAPSQGFTFAMQFEPGSADFNMEYALTCVANRKQPARSPKVIFTIGANGPAQPNVTVVSLYGAQGAWQSTGGGEDYRIDFGAPAN